MIDRSLASEHDAFLPRELGFSADIMICRCIFIYLCSHVCRRGEEEEGIFKSLSKSLTEKSDLPLLSPFSFLSHHSSHLLRLLSLASWLVTLFISTPTNMSSFVRLSSLHRLSRSWPKAAGAVAAPRPASSVAFSLARPYSAAAVTENTDAHTADSEFYIQGRPSTSSHGIPVNSNWKAIEDQPLTGKSVHDLLENAIPAVRHQNFLSKEECSKLVDIIQEHGIVSPKS